MSIAVDQCLDIVRISHIRFCPFWSNELVLQSWVNNNGVTFLFQRTDWEIVEDFFKRDYQTGIAIKLSTSGTCNRKFIDTNFDDIGIGISGSYRKT